MINKEDVEKAVEALSLCTAVQSDTFSYTVLVKLVVYLV